MGLGETYRRLRAQLEEVAPEVVDAGVGLRRAPLDVSAARGFVFISHVGTVHPSGFLPLSAGNVRERQLSDIYRISPLFEELRDLARLQGRCGACEFRTICGGSRSRAFGATGQVFAEEPWCTYRPGTFPYPDDVERLLAAT